MNFKDAIRSSLAASDFLVHGYLADITPEELVARPVPGANHLAWQLGHLITAERHLVEQAAPGSMPELPAGFAERHPRKGPYSDDPADFLTKDQYLELARTIRAATLQALDRLSESDFDRPVEGRVPPFVKKAGECFTTIGNHWALHAGQWVVLRRALGREVIF